MILNNKSMAEEITQVPEQTTDIPPTSEGPSQYDSLGQFVGTERTEVDGGTLFKGTKDGQPFERFVRGLPSQSTQATPANQETPTPATNQAETTPSTPTDTTPTDTTQADTTTKTDNGMRKVDSTTELSDEAQRVQDSLNNYASMLDTQAENLTNQFEKYKDGLDANLRSTIDNIERTFASRKEQMKQINQSTLQGQAIIGNRAGRQRYATEIQTSILSAEERAGVQRLADLDVQEQQLIQQAKFAALTGEWEAYNDYQNQFSNIHKDKVSAIMDLNTLVKNEEDRIYTKQQRALLDQQQDKELLYNEATNKVNSYISVGMELANIPKDVMQNIEEGLQLPEGTFEKYYEGLQDIGQAEMLAGNIDTTKKMMDILALVPSDSTIEINGVEYPGMKEITTGMDTSLMTTDYKNWLLTGQDLAFGDYMRNKKLEENGLPNNINSQIDSISKSFESSPIVKNFVEVQNKKRSIDSIIDLGVGGPGDLSLVFEFMKALDPTSVVRESEYESAAKSGNIFLGWAAKFNGYLKEDGGILPASVKQAFKAITNEKYNIVSQQYDNYFNETSRKINKKLEPYNMSDGQDYLVNFKFADPNDPFGDVDWGNLDDYLLTGF